MANFYLDVSAIGNEYQAFAATPTWGGNATDKPLPMDGNGKAGPGHSAAVAIAEIKVNALPADGNMLIIAGATITAKTTVAAKNQFAIGASIAACVTNIVSLLNTYGASSNQCDAAVNVGSSALQLALPYWQSARVKPGTTDTVQIATRIAGSTLNQATNSNVGISHSGWATSPTFTQLAGGADGPFAYFMADSTVFGKTAGLYGMFMQKAGGPGEPGVNDVINVRTKRSGTNLTANFTSNVDLATYNFTQHNFLYDDGTVWSGDSGVFTLAVNNANSGAQRSWYLSSMVHVCAVTNNFVFSSLGVGTGRLALYGLLDSAEGVLFDGVKFVEPVGQPSTHLGFRFSNTIVFNDCWLSFQYARQFVYANSLYAMAMRFNNCKFSVANLAAKWTGFVDATSAGGNNGDVLIEFRGGEFDSANAFGADSPVVGTPTSGNVRVVFDSVKNLDFSVAGFTASFRYGGYTFLYVAPDESRQFRYECGTHIVDWRAGASYPTLNSMLPSGDYWCQRLLWQVASSFSRPVYPIKTALFYRDSSAQQKLEWEFLLPSGFAPTKSELAMRVRYQDSGGVIRNETTLLDWSKKLAGSAAAQDTSTAVWANRPGGYTAKKLSLTTAYAIKQNTEITATLELAGTPSSQQVLYFNPEIQVVTP